MGIKKGTKLTDNPKDSILRVRMDKLRLQCWMRFAKSRA